MARLTAKVEQWFEVPGDADNAKLKIAHLYPGDLEKIEAETSRWMGRKGEGTDFVTELQYNPQMKYRKIRLACVTDWDGFYDEYGNKLKFSKKSLELYLDADPKIGVVPDSNAGKPISEWIDDFLVELSGTVASEEDQKKI